MMSMSFLAEKKQLLLGRKDDLRNINLENGLKVANKLDRTYDK